MPSFGEKLVGCFMDSLVAFLDLNAAQEASLFFLEPGLLKVVNVVLDHVVDTPEAGQKP